MIALTFVIDSCVEPPLFSHEDGRRGHLALQMAYARPVSASVVRSPGRLPPVVMKYGA